MLDTRHEATAFVDAIDEFIVSASHAVRQQVMRSKSGLCKSLPFQSLKGTGVQRCEFVLLLISFIIGTDASGYAYALTLARFIVFARIFLELPDADCMHLLVTALTEKCTTTGVCCLEGYLLCLCEHAPLHFKVRMFENGCE